jgi:CysZ protein
MFASLRKAANSLFDGAFSGAAVKALVLTAVLYAALFVGAVWGVHHLPRFGADWVNQALGVLVPVLLLLLPFLLGAPVMAFFASLFLNDLAKAVEARYYPGDPKAQGAPFGASLIAGLKLFMLVTVLDLLLLPLDAALPGIAEAATILLNGWLLGLEYFELVALRHVSRRASEGLRRRHRGVVFTGGVLIALLAAVPFVNFIAPLFATAFMVHLYKRYEHQEHPA